MEKIEGCDCKVKRTRLVRTVDWLCGALLIGITVWVACRYAALPDKIPTHFGADGVIATCCEFVCVCDYNVHGGRKPVGDVHADSVNGTLYEFLVLGRSTFSGKIKHV